MGKKVLLICILLITPILTADDFEIDVELIVGTEFTASFEEKQKGLFSYSSIIGTNFSTQYGDIELKFTALVEVDRNEILDRYKDFFEIEVEYQLELEPFEIEFINETLFFLEANHRIEANAEVNVEWDLEIFTATFEFAFDYHPIFLEEIEPALLFKGIEIADEWTVGAGCKANVILYNEERVYIRQLDNIGGVANFETEFIDWEIGWLTSRDFRRQVWEMELILNIDPVEIELKAAFEPKTPETLTLELVLEYFF